MFLVSGREFAWAIVINVYVGILTNVDCSKWITWGINNLALVHWRTDNLQETWFLVRGAGRQRVADHRDSRQPLSNCKWHQCFRLSILYYIYWLFVLASFIAFTHRYTGAGFNQFRVGNASLASSRLESCCRPHLSFTCPDFPLDDALLLARVDRRGDFIRKCKCAAVSAGSRSAQEHLRSCGDRVVKLRKALVAQCK